MENTDGNSFSTFNTVRTPLSRFSRNKKIRCFRLGLRWTHGRGGQNRSSLSISQRKHKKCLRLSGTCLQGQNTPACARIEPNKQVRKQQFPIKANIQIAHVPCPNTTQNIRCRHNEQFILLKSKYDLPQNTPGNEVLQLQYGT